MSSQKITLSNKPFRRLGDRKPVDFIPYIKQKLAEATEEVKIYVACKCKEKGPNVEYAVVIVLHYGNRGGTCIYKIERFPRIKDGWSRLWNEVELSLQVADEMVLNGLPQATYIDIDLNPDPEFNSNKVLRSALGYVKSSGYSPRCKPESIPAVNAAAKLVE
jgi:predicted RNase H-related nuclease YkuK (DUF458 family)